MATKNGIIAFDAIVVVVQELSRLAVKQTDGSGW
jgi:hypothetical protein